MRVIVTLANTPFRVKGSPSENVFASARLPTLTTNRLPIASAPSSVCVAPTNNLSERIIEHYTNRGQPKTFAGKYYCYNLIYYECFQYVYDAIAREKELKGWRREKKLDLIKTMNHDWTFLNPSVCNGWPPKKTINRF
jgi:putative endonuclease